MKCKENFYVIFLQAKIVSQKIIDDKLYIYCPYNANYQKKKKLNIVVVFKSSAWEFAKKSDQETQISHPILRETYGEDGTEHKIEYVSLKLSVIQTSYNNLMIAGRIIAARKRAR